MPVVIPDDLLTTEGFAGLIVLEEMLAREFAQSAHERDAHLELAKRLDTLQISLQPKQQLVSDSTADIVIFGGAAFAGKTYGLLLEPLKHISVPGFGAVCFRRTYNRITQERGMWDETQGLYRRVGGTPKKGDLSWEWPNDVAVSFSHMQYEDDKYAHFGAQICLLLWDQLEEFTEGQFFFLLGRNRSTCGVKPYCRATCNPEPESWLARFLAWWIDQDTGDPILERGGMIRWFVRLPDDSFAWADTADELRAKYNEETCKSLLSVTFIPGTMDDNPIGRVADPTYEAKLMTQPAYLRERLRYGNWKSRPSAGKFFKAHWFDITNVLPAGCRKVRFWDLAASEPTVGRPDPDYTVGALGAMDLGDFFYVGEIRRDRVSPGSVEKMILHTAEQDGHKVEIGIEQEPGAGGKITAFDIGKKLAARGFTVHLYPKRIKTEIAAGPLASAAELGSVRLVRADWNKDFLDELVNFPDGAHDDQVVAITGAHGVLTKTMKGERVGSGWSFAPVGK